MTLSLFVLSDIHAFDGSLGVEKPSYFDITRPDGAGADNPIAHLRDLISKRNIVADYLVIGGDLGDKAQPNAVRRAWKEIQELKTLLKARNVVATVGNHDVDSRHVHNDHDAKGLLLDLTPGFPLENDEDNNHFWTHHFCCIVDQYSKARFVVLNSSGYHGEHDPNKKDAEYVHGRVSERTQRRLKVTLDAGGRAPLNILVCHHHPQRHDEHYLGDWDDMRGGPTLLASLDSAKYGPWIVFHGHKQKGRKNAGFAVTLRAKLATAARFGLTGTPIDETMVNTHREFGPMMPDGQQERYLSYYGNWTRRRQHNRPPSSLATGAHGPP